MKPTDKPSSRVDHAIEVAKQAHEGQFRKTGEPYIIHPLAVKKILEEWGMDEMKALEMLAEQACHCLDFNFCESVRIFRMDGTEVTNKEISWL